MNVKPGDLAIQIKSFAGNEGIIVCIVSFIGDIYDIECGTLKDVWCVDNQRPVKTIDGSMSMSGLVPDAYLRPISGLPLQEDEHTEIKMPA